MTEFQLIEKLKKKIPAKLQGTIGIGDDAGALNGTLLAADTVADGVDFISSKIKSELAGRKSLAVNLSDIAAMGGKPTAFVVSLGIPKNFSEKWVLKFYDGLMALAKKHKISCLGGDITKAEQFFASIAILGSVGKKVVLRGGAKTGDWIGVTGKLGGSILGKHASFEPRLKEGKALAETGVSAMIDISDGLLQDLEHILKSSGKGAELEMKEIPISKEGWKLAGNKYSKALEHALTDGEDFELLFTASASVKKKIDRSLKVYWFGRITSQKNRIVWCISGKKTSAPKLSKKGFTHF